VALLSTDDTRVCRFRASCGDASINHCGVKREPKSR
jgi:hypothetical protein